jgi:hypothetical protein
VPQGLTGRRGSAPDAQANPACRSGDSVVSNLNAVLLSPSDDLLLAPVRPAYLPVARELSHLSDAERLADLVDELGGRFCKNGSISVTLRRDTPPLTSSAPNTPPEDHSVPLLP